MNRLIKSALRAAGTMFAATAFVGPAATAYPYYSAYGPGWSWGGYSSYAYAPVYGGGQTYYSSYRNRHAYGYRFGPNRPTDSFTINKRHLEGTE